METFKTTLNVLIGLYVAVIADSILILNFSESLIGILGLGMIVCVGVLTYKVYKKTS